MAKKVLVVEDDSNISELLRLYLEKDGFEVFQAVDGGEGIRMAQEKAPDLILLDIMLPVVDGWVVCTEVRKTSQVPIIMLTAKGETFDKISGLEMGADDYVTKPFEVKELMARIHAVMRRTEGDAPAAQSAEKKLVFDKLVVNLDSYELVV
ncbi:MAG: response regulator transcription factor, partial [Deltaproteobacteria bacterium]|nr:response regulator transcription factor [Deltaproteobacteria bacterium]